MKAHFAIAVLCSISLVLVGEARAGSVSDWQHDIDEIVKDVQAIHPNPFFKTGRIAFLRRAEALKGNIPRLTEEQRVVGAMQLIALIGDTHTQLEPDRPDFAWWYPIRIYEFTDGYFVTAAHKSAADLAGARVLEVAGQPVDSVVQNTRGLMGADNLFARKEYVFAFSNASLMKGLGYAPATGELKVKFKLMNGNEVERVLTPHTTNDTRFKKDDSTFEWHFQAEMGGPPFGGIEEWISVYDGLPYSAFRTTDLTRPLRLMNRRFFVAKSVPEKDAFYIQSNVVGDDFAEQFRGALEEVDKVKPRRLIVDLRYNFGGDGSHVPAMARQFIKREDAPPWKELYILTGRRTLSAGIMAAVAVMDNTDNTVIGEPMSAPVNSYGDAISINFPRIGMHMDLSTAMHQLGDSNDVSEFAPVDVPAPFTFAEYASGRDPAIDPILGGEEMRSLPRIALADGGSAARRVYAERVARFREYAWWSPPTEIALRRAGQKLLELKRFQDAIETDKLNAEIHPEIWNVWYNLAKAQMAAGLTRDALESYRHVLQIDPTNDNEVEIRKAFADAGVVLN
jgi:hypothetical protein